MTQADIFITLQWWFTLFILGAVFLPVTSVLFKSFFDRGYIFAKLLGLITTSYIIFLLGVLHVIPFSLAGIIGIALILAIGSFLLLPKKKQLLQTLKKTSPLFLFEELVFLGILFFWTYIHGFNPDIHGLEKYMDFGFINSILRTEYFPPKDMWFTPLSINYYYFGHLATAVLTKLSNLSAAITFNLMLATVAAWCFTATFSIAGTLTSFLVNKGKIGTMKQILAGILTATLATFAGNLHTLYTFFTAYPNESPVPLWQLLFNPSGYPNSYWYPNATRFIYNTIHEFPIYSWVVADLHGHVLDIPFVLLTIALLLSLFLTLQNRNAPKEKEIKKATIAKNWKLFGRWQIEPWYLFLPFVGFLLSIMYMTNAWDGAIYLLLTFFVLLALFLGKTIHDLRHILFSFLVVFASFLLFALPYNFFFKPFASGIGVLCSPEFLTNIGKFGPLLFEKDHCQHSPWWQLLTLYGFFYFFVLSFLVFLAKTKKLLKTDTFVLLLILLSTVLIILPELIYLKDIYPAHYRANTMFKLVFQAFILLSISSGYIIVRMLLGIKNKIFAIGYLLITVFLVTIVMLYPYLAIKSYYGLETYRGINGIEYLKTMYPTDYEAIAWINTNITGQPVILEAQGDSYTDYGRVSTNTGLPTLLGWTVHEWLWRGTYDIPAPRIDEIKNLYETVDIAQAKALLQKYNVEYVFIGNLEYQKYPELQEEKFAQLGKIVFQKGSTKIYQIY